MSRNGMFRLDAEQWNSGTLAIAFNSNYEIARSEEVFINNDSYVGDIDIPKQIINIMFQNWNQIQVSQPQLEKIDLSLFFQIPCNLTKEGIIIKEAADAEVPTRKLSDLASATSMTGKLIKVSYRNINKSKIQFIQDKQETRTILENRNSQYIIIVLLDRREFLIDSEPMLKILDIKRHVFNVSSISIDCQTLMHKNYILNDERTIQHYNILGGDVLVLICQLPLISNPPNIPPSSEFQEFISYQKYYGAFIINPELLSILHTTQDFIEEAVPEKLALLGLWKEKQIWMTAVCIVWMKLHWTEKNFSVQVYDAVVSKAVNFIKKSDYAHVDFILQQAQWFIEHLESKTKQKKMDIRNKNK